MERIDGNTWRTDNGDEVRAQGLRVTVEFGEKTKAEVLCAVEAVRAENDRLRDERVRYEDLAHILDREWNINVEWDGVRRIWYVGLTELGVQLRDEREAVRFAHIDTISELEDQNAKLREMAVQALQIIKHVNVVMAIDYARYSALMSMARELGIEVEE